jgi:hypothetical protein
LSVDAARDQLVCNNHWIVDGQSLQRQDVPFRGSSAHGAPVASGMDQFSTILFNSCDFNDGGNLFLMAGENLFNTGLLETFVQWEMVIWQKRTKGKSLICKEEMGN